MNIYKMTKKIMIVSLVANSISFKTMAMSQKPIPSNRNQPVTVKPPVREPAAVTTSLTPIGFDVFNEVAYPVGGVVDSSYKNYRELIPVRDESLSHYTDLCDSTLDRKDRFADRIAYSVEIKMQPARAQLGYVASYFGLKSDVSTYLPNSLISHPLCNVTSTSLNSTLNGKNIPSAATIKKANAFVDRMNQYRREALSGQRDGYVKASKLWSKMMMCVSYMESLTTADTAKSKSVAQKYAPAGYRRPAGVLFYEDPNQNPESRLNIGLFQFTPSAGGNVQSCIREWNQLYPRCGIPTNSNSAEMIKILGSSLQTFNSFCAVAKVTGMFAVQVNTTKWAHTHPANLKADGSLKVPGERCVTPHFGSKSYNHFGPFQNSAGFTLDQILTCVMSPE